MKFIVSSTTLLKNLQAISGVLSTNNTLPILDNFLFEINNNKLIVFASDLETTMKVSIPLTMAEDDGVIAVPAKILLDTLKTLPEIPITFNVDKQTYIIEITTDEGKYRLSGYNGDEFPKVPILESAATLIMPVSTLADCINKTIFAAGNDELRPVMSGVFCQLTPENITFVATDAHKLVRYRRSDTVSESEAQFILPKKPLNQLKNVLPYNDDKVTIEYNQTNASFTFNNINLVCRLIDGKYPNYEAVIPVENPNRLIVNRIQLANSIKRVSIFANQSTHQVRFKITGLELVLSAEDLDFSNEAKERLTCNYQGEDIEIGFNSKFIIEMLNNLGTDEALLEMSSPNRAGLLSTVNAENTNEDILMLVMPVMLNQ